MEASSKHGPRRFVTQAQSAAAAVAAASTCHGTHQSLQQIASAAAQAAKSASSAAATLRRYDETGNAFLVGTRLRRIVRRSFTEAWEPVEDSSRVWESLRAQVSDCEVSVEQLQVSLAKLPQINSFHLGPLLEALTLHMDAHEVSYLGRKRVDHRLKVELFFLGECRDRLASLRAERRKMTLEDASTGSQILRRGRKTYSCGEALYSASVHGGSALEVIAGRTNDDLQWRRSVAITVDYLDITEKFPQAGASLQSSPVIDWHVQRQTGGIRAPPPPYCPRSPSADLQQRLDNLRLPDGHFEISHHIHLARNCLKAAQAAFLEERYRQCRADVQQSSELARTLPVQDEQQVDSLDRVRLNALCSYHLDSPRTALESLHYALTFVESAARHPKDFIAIHQALAELYTEMSNFTQAEIWCQKTLDAARVCFPPKSTSISEAYALMSAIKAFQKDDFDATYYMDLIPPEQLSMPSMCRLILLRRFLPRSLTIFTNFGELVLPCNAKKLTAEERSDLLALSGLVRNHSLRIRKADSHKTSSHREVLSISQDDESCGPVIHLYVTPAGYSWGVDKDKLIRINGDVSSMTMQKIEAALNSSWYRKRRHVEVECTQLEFD
ncbi:uncharacterized protein MYCGRDRAFT_96209 [Zymoseptoria tritici IPO323]|uniref:Uncharacterized protein n=1 Tax=Zymoseptoria tritici (strain CBS 115943 / IPO323) TaxID=336722 RepID=F9XKR4_ZYMTI|nr:uncharacterized protein MYCGRDRAFT_96209 [Zymoseptoria tritici IPO323]EGP83839.1 hypothetical protein MYCGRDRAFT_96209 [Zymoseptoria tritici IPO323]